MLNKYLRHVKYFELFVLIFLFWFLFFNYSCFAINNNQKMPESELNMFAQNNILFYDPYQCISKNGVNIGSGTCFKVDNSVEASAFWYEEGCLNNGTCTRGVYAPVAYTKESTNHFLLDDTKTDEDFGGLQYIYAENYDIEFDGYEGWIPKFTKKPEANSTQKYYWIVLPAEAYATGFGETYVATFENLSEPVYFITYDTHKCKDQRANYCGKAEADPDGVKIGEQFLGAFSKEGGSPTEAAKITGKLKSFCRIRGNDDEDITVNGTKSNSINIATTSEKKSNSDSSLPSGKDITWIGDSYSVGAKTIIEEKFPGISFGDGVESSSSYIQSNKGVSDRYGGGDSNPPALTILKRLVDAGELKSYLVMAVGTNAGWDDDEVKEFNKIMSSQPDTKVIFVNAKAKAHLASDDNDTNKRLKKLADSNDNYYLADWAAAYDKKYFEKNNTHPTSNGGYKKWVEVIYNVIAGIDNCITYEGDYPQYYQSDYEKSDHENSDQDWTVIDYGSGNVSSSGCGPTSMAMLTTVATGKDVYPQDIINITKSAGSYTTSGGPGPLDPLVGEKYGFEVEVVSYSDLNDAENKMREYLQKGYMLHFSGVGSYPFSSKGHYIGIFKIDSDDNVFIANSSSRGGGNSKMKLHDIVHAGLHYDFTAIKGNGGSGSCDSDYCLDSGSTSASAADNLTEEQAQKLADYYNSDKVSASDWALPYGKNNCVSFSRWFVQALTSMGKKSSLDGNGRKTAHNIATVGGFEEGTDIRAYSVFSVSETQSICRDGLPCGHTGVVVAVNGDDIITVEAMYPSTPARVYHHTASYFVNKIYTNTFTYLDQALDKTKLGEIVGD